MHKTALDIFEKETFNQNSEYSDLTFINLIID